MAKVLTVGSIIKDENGDYNFEHFVIDCIKEPHSRRDHAQIMLDGFYDDVQRQIDEMPEHTPLSAITTKPTDV